IESVRCLGGPFRVRLHALRQRLQWRDVGQALAGFCHHRHHVDAADVDDHARADAVAENLHAAPDGLLLTHGLSYRLLFTRMASLPARPGIGSPLDYGCVALPAALDTPVTLTPSCSMNAVCGTPDTVRTGSTSLTALLLIVMRGVL